jgi:DNA-binding LytR/AlgR family response regulator
MRPPKIVRLIDQSNPVLYLQSDENYTFLYFKNKRREISGYSLKCFENLPEFKSFIRVNRHYMINPEFIKDLYLKDNAPFIELLDGHQFLVSRRRYKLMFGNLIFHDAKFAC